MSPCENVDTQPMTTWTMHCKFSNELCHIGCLKNQKSIIVLTVDGQADRSVRAREYSGG